MLGHHQSEVHTGDSTLLPALISGLFLLEKKSEYVVLYKSTHLSWFLLALPSSLLPGQPHILMTSQFPSLCTSRAAAPGIQLLPRHVPLDVPWALHSTCSINPPDHLIA